MSTYVATVYLGLRNMYLNEECTTFMLQAALHFIRYGSLIDADLISALDRYS